MAVEGTRDAFGRAIINLAKQNTNVYTMDCDLGRSTRAYSITEVDPNRFLDMGISEQDMISTAAGMASMGKVVYVNSFSVFLTGRAYDQIRQQVSLAGMNVKICGSSSGLTQGPDGATHQSVTDMNLMRGLPNMVVLSPADSRQTEEIIDFSYKYKGPVYIRLSRYPVPDLIPDNLSFELGKAQILKEAEDVMLIATGPILKNVIAAADLLLKDGISCGIANFPTIKPMDEAAVKKLASRYSMIFTIEEHSIIGGLGSGVAEIMAEMNRDDIRSSLSRLGIRDCYGESGAADELLAMHGLDARGIADSVIEKLS